MRLIDADKLIEELEELEDAYRFYHDEAARGFASAICKVNDQPTTDGWIPVSERLPNKNGKYFVTMWDEIIGPYTTEWHFYNGKFMPFIYHTNRKVLAWQPLPQPYKESE